MTRKLTTPPSRESLREREDDRRHAVSKTFEEQTTATLEAQDRMLERVEQKLDCPVLNGGFEDLTRKVEKVALVQELLKEAAQTTAKQVGEIHTVIYDPEKGIYGKVKDHGIWIDGFRGKLKWFVALLITGALTGMGKLAYDFMAGHIHFTP